MMFSMFESQTGSKLLSMPIPFVFDDDSFEHKTCLLMSIKKIQYRGFIDYSIKTRGYFVETYKPGSVGQSISDIYQNNWNGVKFVKYGQI